MNILVNVGCYYLRLPIDANVGPILTALSESVIYSQEGWGNEAKYVPQGAAENPTRPSVEFVGDERFKDASPLVDGLVKQLKHSESRWLESTKRAEVAEKELKELKAKLASIAPNGDGEGSHA